MKSLITAHKNLSPYKVEAIKQQNAKHFYDNFRLLARIEPVTDAGLAKAKPSLSGGRYRLPPAGRFLSDRMRGVRKIIRKRDLRTLQNRGLQRLK